MLFTITRDQYQRYKESAALCRQYITEKFPKLCSVVDTFNSYFGTDNVDVYGDRFKQKSLLLTLLEDYNDYCECNPNPVSLERFIDMKCPSDSRIALFSHLAIYVHWPVVTVTNERNQSVDIYDLYAKVPIYPDGRLYSSVQLARSTYTYEQFVSDYMHSHVMGIPDNPSTFMEPCFGTGPLLMTQGTLCRSCDENNLWDLFCLELDRYVHVESISGVPYRYLDKIGSEYMSKMQYYGMRSLVFKRINRSIQKKKLFHLFFKYILNKKQMKFSFYNGMYSSSYSDTEWILWLSNEFLKYFAMISATDAQFMTSSRSSMSLFDELLHDKLLYRVKVKDNCLYSADSAGRASRDYRAYDGLHVLYFKGEDIISHVNEHSGYSENIYYALNPVLALGFLDQCLNYLNIYEHEKEKNVIQDNIEEENEIIDGYSNDSAEHTANSRRYKNTFTNYPIGEKRISFSLYN